MIEVHNIKSDEGHVGVSRSTAEALVELKIIRKVTFDVLPIIGGRGHIHLHEYRKSD